MQIYCKKCKKKHTHRHTQVTRFQKKIVLISKNKIKGKSKYAICLIEKTLIKDEYDLEIELQVYLQFFTD